MGECMNSCRDEAIDASNDEGVPDGRKECIIERIKEGTKVSRSDKTNH